jgi:hypothetical protein
MVTKKSLGSPKKLQKKLVLRTLTQLCMKNLLLIRLTELTLRGSDGMLNFLALD